MAEKNSQIYSMSVYLYVRYRDVRYNFLQSSNDLFSSSFENNLFLTKTNCYSTSFILTVSAFPIQAVWILSVLTFNPERVLKISKVLNYRCNDLILPFVLDVICNRMFLKHFVKTVH